MERHTLIFRFGADTSPYFQPHQGRKVTEIQMLDDNGNLLYNVGQTIFSSKDNGFRVTEVGTDLLLVAAAVYAADKRISRRIVSQDGWSREIDIYLPLNAPQVWSSLCPHLEKMLGFLTGDLWRFAFRKLTKPIAEIAEFCAELQPPRPSHLCLFSGGLDSFIGAIDLLQDGNKPVLVSHSWTPSDVNHQAVCITALEDEYGKDKVSQVRSRIGFGEHDLKITSYGESTERSRSFLFFSIAGAIASGMTRQIPIVVPENGLISLNIPLDPVRLGAFSTRTTHPYFIARFNELLAALKIPTWLENPYRHKTKGEMVKECKNPETLQTNVANTMSCSSPNKARWDGETSGVHCGHCLPCLIRRAALAPNDPTAYTLENLTSKPLTSNQAEGEHVRSFELAISRLQRQSKTAELLVQRSGPLSDHPGDVVKYAAMYQRGLAEVEDLLKGVKTVPKV